MNRNVVQFGKQAMTGRYTKAHLQGMFNRIDASVALTDEEYAYCVGMIADFGAPSKVSSFTKTNTHNW